MATAVATALSTLATLATITNAAPAAAQPTYVVTQGDRFTIEKQLAHGTANMDCTIGFNDHSQKMSYTAAHCGKSGDTVSLITPSGTVPAGTLYRSKKFSMSTDSAGNQYGVNDLAIIEWFDHVRLGHNIYSGDYRANPARLKLADQVCFHGSTSHANSTRFTCGPFISVWDEIFLSRLASRPGDSGGPVWSPEHGFLGVINGTGTLSLTGPISDSMSFLVSAHSNTSDRAPGPDDIYNLAEWYFMSHYRMGGEFAATHDFEIKDGQVIPIKKQPPTSTSSSSSSGSSNEKTATAADLHYATAGTTPTLGAIATVVAPLLALLVFLLPLLPR